LRHPEQPPLELRGSEQVGLPVFSADGHHAATISDDGIARVWELESLQASTQPQVFRPEDDQGYQLLSPDHRWLLTRAMGGASHLWDMSAERPWGHPVTLTDKEGRWLSSSDNARLPFSPDGRWLITSRGENVAQVWDLTTVKTDPRPFEIKLDKSAIDFSPDSRLLVAACADGVTRVWNLPFNKSHKPAFELPRRPSPDAALFFGNVSRLLVAVSRDESRLFDLSQGAPTPQSGIQLVAFPRPPSSPSNRFADTSREKPLFSPDDRWLAALDGQDVRLWDLSAGPPSRPALSVSHPGSEGGHIEMKFSHKGGWLLTRVGKGGKLLRLTREPPGVGVTQISYWLYEAFSPDDRWLFVKDVNKAPELWELSETPHAARSLEEARIFSRGDYVFSPDSHWLMVNGSSDPSATEKDLLIWDLRDPTLTRRKMPKTAISGMPFSPNSRWLVTYRSNLKAPASTAFWDLSLQSPFEKPGFELGPTGGIVFSPDAKWAASADSTEHYVALWDLSEAPTQTEPLLLPSAELNDYSGGVRINLRLLFDTDHLYVLGSEILRWELDAGRLRLLARRAAGRELNEMERLRYLQDFESDEGAAARGPGKSRPGARH
jgi:WD40 repeat protein